MLIASLSSAVLPVLSSIVRSAHAAEAKADAVLPPLVFAVQPPRQASTHPPVLFLMHGYGSNEHDLLPIAASLPPEFLVISLRAPYKASGGGDDSYQWYQSATTDGRQDGKPDEIVASRAAVEASVTRLAKQYDVDPKRIFIGGFSQGAAMTYAVALANPTRYRGAVVLSGALLVSVKRGLDAAVDRSHLAVFVGQGRADRRVPFIYADEAAMQLSHWHVPLDFNSYPGMTHEVGEQEIADLARWLEKTAS